jgi:hypothetical protein
VQTDSDGDGIYDFIEEASREQDAKMSFMLETKEQGLIQVERPVRLDPTSAHSDEDGLLDGEEVSFTTSRTIRDGNVHLVATLEDGKSDSLPSVENTDRMGLNDAREDAKNSNAKVPERLMISAHYPIWGEEKDGGTVPLLEIPPHISDSSPGTHHLAGIETWKAGFLPPKPGWVPSDVEYDHEDAFLLIPVRVSITQFQIEQSNQVTHPDVSLALEAPFDGAELVGQIGDIDNQGSSFIKLIVRIDDCGNTCLATNFQKLGNIQLNAEIDKNSQFAREDDKLIDRSNVKVTVVAPRAISFRSPLPLHTAEFLESTQKIIHISTTIAGLVSAGSIGLKVKARTGSNSIALFSAGAWIVIPVTPWGVVRIIANGGIEMWQQKLEDVGQIDCSNHMDKECVVVKGGFAMVRET